MEYKVFGCKTNKYFTERWLSHEYLEGKEGCFLASCVVTDRAKAKWLKYALRKLQTLSPPEKLYLSGCGNLRDGRVNPEFYTNYPELATFRDRIELLSEDPSDFGIPGAEKQKHSLSEKVRRLSLLTRKAVFTRKYLVIQTGCDNYCTFCLTVQARGRHVSRPQAEIIDEVRAFVDGGGKEVVLTGTNLGAWGSDSSNDFLSSRFVELVSAILEKTSIERLRISSLGVEFCSHELLDLFMIRRVNPYIHLSVQSGSSSILRSMNRHYDSDTLQSVLAYIRSRERDDTIPLRIGADIIVGFPGETEDGFLDSLNIIDTYSISQVHAFPFSPHVSHLSVPAGRFSGQIPEHMIHARLERMNDLGKRTHRDFMIQNHDRTLHVLLEKTDGVHFSGWSENYLFCNEKNFIPLDGSVLEKGNVITGVYRSEGLEDEGRPRAEGYPEGGIFL